MLPRNRGERYIYPEAVCILFGGRRNENYCTRRRLIVSEFFWEPRHATDSDGDDDDHLIL